jgi:hypothetical protein
LKATKSFKMPGENLQPLPQPNKNRFCMRI